VTLICVQTGETFQEVFSDSTLLIDVEHIFGGKAAKKRWQMTLLELITHPL
jgi:hypothetical protein